MLSFALLTTLILAFSYLNQHAGGGPFRINTFLQDKVGFDLGRSLFTATILLFGVLSTLILFVPAINIMWVTGSSLGFLIWRLNGWGSYFDIGATVTEYNDKPEVPWIDWILYWIFGPKWNPSNSGKPNRDKIKWDITEHGLPFGFAVGFIPPDLITSPSGQARPYEWRRIRDTVGLFLRHLHAIAFFGFQAWFFANPWLILLTIPFALVATGVYYFTRIPSINAWIRAKAPHLFSTNKYMEFKPDPNSYAEAAVGGLAWGILTFVVIALGS